MISNMVMVNGGETMDGQDTYVAKLVEYYKGHS